EVVAKTAAAIAPMFRAKVAVVVPDDQDRLAVRSEGDAMSGVDLGAAQWAYDNAQPAGMGTDTLAGSEFLYLPLRAPLRIRALLAPRPGAPTPAGLPRPARPPRARTGSLRRRRAEGARRHGVGGAAHLAPFGGIAGLAPPARGAGRPRRVARVDATAAVGRAA